MIHACKLILYCYYTFFIAEVSTIIFGTEGVTLPLLESIGLFDIDSPYSIQLFPLTSKSDKPKKFYPMIQLEFPKALFSQSGSSFIVTLNFTGPCNCDCGLELGTNKPHRGNFHSDIFVNLCNRVSATVDSDAESHSYSCNGSPNKLYIVYPRGTLSHIHFSF